MPERFVFIHPARLFAILRESADDTVRFIFRRGTRSGHEAGMHVVDLGADAVERYLAGGYVRIYLTLGKVPRSPEDWDFTDRALHELIIIQGCRTRDNILELCKLRPLARVSRAKPLFDRIDRRIKKRCRKGLSSGKTMHADMWYDPEVAGMELRHVLDVPESVYRIPAPQSEN